MRFHLIHAISRFSCQHYTSFRSFALCLEMSVLWSAGSIKNYGKNSKWGMKWKFSRSMDDREELKGCHFCPFKEKLWKNIISGVTASFILAGLQTKVISFCASMQVTLSILSNNLRKHPRKCLYSSTSMLENLSINVL